MSYFYNVYFLRNDQLILTLKSVTDSKRIKNTLTLTSVWVLEQADIGSCYDSKQTHRVAYRTSEVFCHEKDSGTNRFYLCERLCHLSLPLFTDCNVKSVLLDILISVSFLSRSSSLYLSRSLSLSLSMSLCLSLSLYLGVCFDDSQLFLVWFHAVASGFVPHKVTFVGLGERTSELVAEPIYLSLIVRLFMETQHHSTLHRSVEMFTCCLDGPVSAGFKSGSGTARPLAPGGHFPETSVNTPEPDAEL